LVIGILGGGGLIGAIGFGAMAIRKREAQRSAVLGPAGEATVTGTDPIDEVE
jgi:hypothetical protein